LILTKDEIEEIEVERAITPYMTVEAVDIELRDWIVLNSELVLLKVQLEVQIGSLESHSSCPV